MRNVVNYRRAMFTIWGFQRGSPPLAGESREGSALSGRTGPVSVTGGENNPFTTRIGL